MSHRDAQLAQLRTIAEELTGTSWPAYPDRVVIKGEVDPEVDEPEPSDEPPPPAPEPVGSMWESWEARRTEISLELFDKGAWADLQEGKVEALAGRVAKLERDAPQWAQPAPYMLRFKRQVRIDRDIAERYNVGRMIAGYFDDTVRNAAVPPDDTDEVQGYIDRGEPLPGGRGYRVTRPLEVPAGGKVVGGGAARFEILPAARPELTVDEQFWGPVEKEPRQRRRHFRTKGSRRHG